MIYRTALDPRDYDEFMVRWNDWMDARVHDLAELKSGDPELSFPDISAHFELALRLVERMTDSPETLPTSGPCMLVQPSGLILWQNAEADRKFDNKLRSNVMEKTMSRDHADQLTKFLAHVSETGAHEPIVIQITPDDGGRPIAMRAEPMRKEEGETFALLSALAAPWPSAMDRLLIRTHSLTESETAICALISAGMTAPAIAKRRETSVETVRTQIKRIQGKTQTRTLTELATHLAALQRLAETMPASTPAQVITPNLYGRMSEFVLDGRRMDVEEHGPEDGRPVLFIHGMLDGTAITARITRGLHERNLRLVCPHRPSFGRSDEQAGPALESPERLATDLRRIVKARNAKNPALIGHMAGAVYTADAAEACTARGIVHVSGGVPIRSNRQFDAMSRRQRLVAYTARYAPSVLPFVIDAGIRQIRGDGAETFLASLYEQAPIDGELLKDPEIRSIVLEGYRFAVAQGKRAFAVDSKLVVQDWTERFHRGAPCPVELIHGAHDPVVAVDSVRSFAEEHDDRVSVRVVDDAGQLVFYQSPETVLDAAARLF